MFFPINTRAIGEILAGYISESIKSDMEYEEKRRKEKQEKEHAKIMERIKKEDEDNRRFHNLLRFGSREEIEGYYVHIIHMGIGSGKNIMLVVSVIKKNEINYGI